MEETLEQLVQNYEISNRLSALLDIIEDDYSIEEFKEFLENYQDDGDIEFIIGEDRYLVYDLYEVEDIENSSSDERIDGIEDKLYEIDLDYLINYINWDGLRDKFSYSVEEIYDLEYLGCINDTYYIYKK